jgi:hypothetical protein
VLAGGSLASTVVAVAIAGHQLADGSATVAVLSLLVLTGVAGALLVGAVRSARWPVVRLGAVLALTAVLIGPVTWSVATAASPHTGSSVKAGPVNGALLPGAGSTPAAASSADPALLSALRRDTDDWTWTAATVGRKAAALQLAAGAPVMPIGGFFGRDPAPTLAGFEADVRAHRIHWYVPGLHGSGSAHRIDRWVRAHAPSVRVGGTTIYDLAGLAAGHHEDMT